jgi:hypothetical protein
MITLTEQLAEARRELALRRKLYPGWVEQGRLTHEAAYHQLACMAAIVETLRTREGETRQGSLFGETP